jgi:flagellar basal body-associated protein FliL
LAYVFLATAAVLAVVLVVVVVVASAVVVVLGLDDDDNDAAAADSDTEFQDQTKGSFHVQFSATPTFPTDILLKNHTRYQKYWLTLQT